MKLTTEQIKQTVANIRMNDADKAALLKQALEYSDNGALAVIAMHFRRQAAGK